MFNTLFSLNYGLFKEELSVLNIMHVLSKCIRKIEESSHFGRVRYRGIKASEARKRAQHLSAREKEYHEAMSIRSQSGLACLRRPLTTTDFTKKKDGIKSHTPLKQLKRGKA